MQLESELLRVNKMAVEGEREEMAIKKLDCKDFMCAAMTVRLI
jgi:hypothetical protein